jgi:hypothetical protein
MSVDDRTWFRVILTTYGAWLYGDARGFRTRHHRQHIDGDYKNPPTEDYSEFELRSRESLQQNAVSLAPSWQPLVGDALYSEFTRLGAWIPAIAVATQHAHLMAKMPSGRQRHWPGRAKRKVTLVLRQQGWQGKLWGVRSKAIPIRDVSHYENALRYILAHADQGAWTAEWQTEPERIDRDC